jgi:NAD(P)-dependent dehydrogenase (short-subunit alcohol dehydrogenase family)
MERDARLRRLPCRSDAPAYSPAEFQSGRASLSDARRSPLPVEADDVERVLADVDAHRGNSRVRIARHGGTRSAAPPKPTSSFRRVLRRQRQYMARLSGEVAIVTGAARGIGRAYSVAPAREGASVVSFDVNDSGATAAEVEAAGGAALAITGDVTDDGSIQRMMLATIERFGRLDILINNAAVLAPLSIRSSADISLGDFDRILRVNVRGTFQCVRAAVPWMRKSGGGKIVNISLTTAFGGPPMMHYIASKGAVISMIYAMAEELGPDNICVNTLAVGFTESDGVIEQPPEVINAVRERVLGKRVIKRSMLPGDVANAMLSLVTEASDFVTGHTLVMDGGFVMR